MRTDLLDGLQELKLFGVHRHVFIHRLMLVELVCISEEGLLFRILLQLPKWLTSIFHFLRIRTETLNGVLHEGIGFAVLPPVLVRTLNRKHGLL